jgi:glucosamine--fructose-6-phosphate aminotransferase (isomerizing)
MCGIFGYVGERSDVGPSVLRALKTLEYRGYDSWGVGVGAGGRVAIEKRTGKIAGATVDLPTAEIGFGHTRWATHGGVTAANAHPHLACGGALAVVHNGIVENHHQLRTELLLRGHRFASETDTEVVAHLLEEEAAAGADLAAALARVFARLEGLNAVIALDARRCELVAAKTVSPLAVGANGKAATIASDALALAGHADRVLYLEDDQLVRLRKGEIALFDRRTLASLPAAFAPLEFEAAPELGGYPHFLAKEVAEQPAVLERLADRATSQVEALAEAIRAADETYLIGCGTAAHAALTGAHLIGRVAARRVEAVVASEFKFYERFLKPGSLVVALSQSGETADVIDAMLAARQRGARLGALVNGRRSTLDRLVDLRVHLGAGPEQCVLSTKAYTAKVAALLLTAHALAGTCAEGEALVRRAAAGLRTMLADGWVEGVRAVARRVQGAEHLFVIGRGLAYTTALEAALKIKEVSYVHAEGFAGGELKHGVIALVTAGTPCVVYAPNDETRADVLSGAAELKSRGGYVVGIGPEPDPVFDVHLATPDVGDAAPLVNALPAQLLGYELALLRGCDPDKPRNLAKSVTVK